MKWQHAFILCISLYIQTSCKKQFDSNSSQNLTSSSLNSKRLYNTAIPLDTSATVYLSGFDSVYAINATTGNPKWIKHYPMGLSTPTVHNNLVYFGSADSYVYALDATTGRQIWKTNVGGIVETIPIVEDFFDNSIVYVSVTTTIGKGYVYALDAGTGRNIWRFETASSISASPTRASNYLFVMDTKNNVYALNVATGGLLWQNTISSFIGYTANNNPTINWFTAQLYIGSTNGYLYGLELVGGGMASSFPISGGSQATSPTISNNIAYIASGPNICAIDLHTNTQNWKYSLPSPDKFFTNPIIYNNFLYVSGPSGINPSLFALNTTTGTEEWRTPSNIISARDVVAYNNTVYMIAYDKNVTGEHSFPGLFLIALDAKKGIQKWRFKISSYSEYYSSLCIGTSTGDSYNPGMSGNQP